MRKNLAITGVLAMTVSGMLVVPTAASAHTVNIRKDRSCGSYLYHSGHDPNTFYGAASTSEISGTCAGHSWVRVSRRNGALSSWHHADRFIQITITNGSGLLWSEHKSYEQDSVTRISH